MDVRNQQERIMTRCPSCGCQTLFIGSGGHLTCSLIGCLNPSVGDRLQELQWKAEQYDYIASVVRPYPFGKKRDEPEPEASRSTPEA